MLSNDRIHHGDMSEKVYALGKGKQWKVKYKCSLLHTVPKIIWISG